MPGNPGSTDVVVVGGGVVGCAAAYYLAGEGLSVTIVERDSVASHASGFAYGGLTPVMGIYIDDPLVALSAYADELHAELAESLPELTGVDTEYRAKPSLMLATRADEVPAIRELYEWLTEHHGGNIGWLEQRELRETEARLSPDIPAGMFTDISHEVEPYKFTLALAQAAESRGAEFRNAQVTGLKLNGGGGVEKVVLGDDEIAAHDVVLAMGPWSGEVGAWTGIDVPIGPLKGQLLRLAAPGDPLAISLSWSGNYATTKPDGLLWAGTTEEEAGFDENPSAEGRDQIMASLVKVLPYLADARLAQHTACLRPVAPDGLPIIGQVPNVPGAWLASGTGRKGILLGPGMGRVVADMIIGKTPEVDVSRLGLERFSEATD
ncbi:MAG: FAD-dependent oxidoreductase [Chloroflexi bacterium]|nr:FAD-dependent oxidoreductase [Chloroflexota bacterium]